MNVEPSESVYQAAELTDGALLAIGRIVRACAEWEDMLKLYIFDLAGVSQSVGVVMLGRTPFSTLTTMAQYLSKMAGEDSLKSYKFVFESSLKNAIACRNAVCHGVFLGIDQSGHYGFLTTKTAEPENGVSVQLVENYSEQTLAAIADAITSSLPVIERELNVGPSRQKRFGRSLQHHRKGQNQPRRSAKPKLPPKP